MTYALITGASKGIGKAIAEELAARKINLLLVARSGDLLTTLANELQQNMAYRSTISRQTWHSPAPLNKSCNG